MEFVFFVSGVCVLYLWHFHVYLVLSCTIGIARRSLGLTPGYQSGFIHGIFIFLWNWKPWMFSEDLKRGVCFDYLVFGLDWNALIKQYREINKTKGLKLHRHDLSITGLFPGFFGYYGLKILTFSLKNWPALLDPPKKIKTPLFWATSKWKIQNLQKKI